MKTEKRIRKHNMKEEGILRKDIEEGKKMKEGYERKNMKEEEL